jgi:hypothetical protein
MDYAPLCLSVRVLALFLMKWYTGIPHETDWYSGNTLDLCSERTLFKYSSVTGYPDW